MATNNTCSKEPQSHHIFIKQNYVHTYAQLYKFKVFSNKSKLHYLYEYIQKCVNTTHITRNQDDPDISQRPAYLFLENNF